MGMARFRIVQRDLGRRRPERLRDPARKGGRRASRPAGAAALEPGTDAGHQRRRRAISLVRRRRERGCYRRCARAGPSCEVPEDPTAMLRVASHVTFSPGIELVGRVWLLGVAEVVDVPRSGLADLARQEAALNAGVRTAIALPVARFSGGPRGRPRPSSYLLRRAVSTGAGGGGAAAAPPSAQAVLARCSTAPASRRRMRTFHPAPLVPASDANRGLGAPLPPTDTAGLAAVVVFLRAIELLRQSAC